MRTLRLALVGAVIVTLFGGLVGTVVARDADSEIRQAAEQGVTFSTGTSRLDELVDVGTEVTGSDGVNRWRGLTAMLIEESSDPRLSGTSTFTWNVNQYGEDRYDGPEWGTVRLENDGGAWSGTHVGFAIPDEEVEWFVAFIVTSEGEGGYEGLVSSCHWYVPGGGWDIQTKCVVMPGDLSDFG